MKNRLNVSKDYLAKTDIFDGVAVYVRTMHKALLFLRSQSTV
jgi:hypothetical protein